MSSSNHIPLTLIYKTNPTQLCLRLNQGRDEQNVEQGRRILKTVDINKQDHSMLQGKESPWIISVDCLFQVFYGFTLDLTFF